MIKSATSIAAAATLLLTLTSCRLLSTRPDHTARGALAGKSGTFVMIDCVSGETIDHEPDLSAERLPPCSTFKIWNTLIGLECGVISNPEEAFYKWDGEKRFIPEWNRDLTLKEAFKVSCVPAFQALAGRIGRNNMQTWIDRIGYGNHDISAGIDCFWLPAKDRETILITPGEQAELLRKLITGKLPFSDKSLAVLKDLMLAARTDRYALYGKTGSRMGDSGKYDMGWFVGFAESNGRLYSFACSLKGDNTSGKDARAAAEKILRAYKIIQ